MAFNASQAIEYARSLAFPRKVGSQGERRALATIRSRLEAFGYKVEEQKFEASTGSDTATALYIAGLQILIVLSFAAWSGPAVLGALPALALLGALALSGWVQRGLAEVMISLPGDAPPKGLKGWLHGLGKRHVTRNLAAHRPVETRAKRPHLFLVAHWDSKSQAIPIWARMVCITVAGGAGAVFGVLSLARVVLPGVTSLAAMAGLLALLAALPVLYVYLIGSGNASPGAVDNAAGVGLLLHLAQVVGETPRGLNVTFVFTGAEELGLQGATAYARAAEGPDGLAGAYVLNLDGVGSEGPLGYVGSADSRIAALARAACVELGWPARRLAWGGALFDHMPFAAAGADAISLITTGAAARRAHTARDAAANLSEEGFRRAGEAVLRVISGIELERAPRGGVQQSAG
jgi:aminopeptidase YwaD